MSKLLHWKVFKKSFTILIAMAIMGVQSWAGEVLTYTLKNGAKVYIVPRQDTKVVSLQVWFRVGSKFENYKEKGISHFLEHMLFNGSEGMPYGEIDKRVESFGGHLNAGTSKDYTFYYITAPYLFYKEGLKLLYKLTLKPLLLEKMVEKEKPIVLEELKRSEDNPKNLLWEEFEKLVYKVSPYRFPILGTQKTIKSFTRSELLSYYKRFYQPQNMAIVVVGRVNPEEVLKEVEETFGREEGRPLKRPKVLKEPPQIKIRRKVIEDERVGKSYWIIGWRVPPIGSKEYYALEVLSEILTGGKTSYLYKALIDKGLAYSVSSGDFARPQDNVFLIYASFDEKNYQKVKEEVLRALEELKKNLKEEEVRKAKEKLLNSLIFSRERVQSVGYEIGYSFALFGNVDFYKTYEENLKKVRKLEVIKLLERFIGKDKPYSEILLKPKGGDK